MLAIIITIYMTVDQVRALETIVFPLHKAIIEMQANKCMATCERNVNHTNEQVSHLIEQTLVGSDGINREKWSGPTLILDVMNPTETSFDFSEEAGKIFVSWCPLRPPSATRVTQIN